MAASFKQSVTMDCYDILGIATDATLKDVNSAYKKLALKYHPDKNGGGDAEFQKIQEAVEILRDPFRRSKHDEELGCRQRFRKYYQYEREEARPRAQADPFSFSERMGGVAGGGWRPHNPWWRNVLDPRERYIYSYGNSVHLDPSSRDSREELARCDRERKLNEESMGRGKEGRMKEEQTTAQGFFKGEFSAKQARWKANPSSFTYYGESEEESRATAKANAKAKETEPCGDSFEVQGDNGYTSDCSLEDLQKQRAYTHGGSRVAESIPDQQLFNQSPAKYTTDSQSIGSDPDSDFDSDSDAGPRSDVVDGQENDIKASRTTTAAGATNKEAKTDESGSSIYYDFSDTQSINHSHYDSLYDISSLGEYESIKSSPKEAEMDRLDVYAHLSPFIPYFTRKLTRSHGRYSEDDLFSELKGMVMETYCGWLEEVRSTIPGAQPREKMMMGKHDTQEQCPHLGLWNKELAHDECEMCHLWRPIYTLICPGCGIKACVRCKFERGKET